MAKKLEFNMNELLINGKLIDWSDLLMGFYESRNFQTLTKRFKKNFSNGNYDATVKVYKELKIRYSDWMTQEQKQFEKIMLDYQRKNECYFNSNNNNDFEYDY